MDTGEGPIRAMTAGRYIVECYGLYWGQFGEGTDSATDDLEQAIEDAALLVSDCGWHKARVVDRQAGEVVYETAAALH